MSKPRSKSSSGAKRPSSADTTACPACHGAVPADQRFCGHCGASMQSQCRACGEVNPAANKFCGTCGADLAGDKASFRAAHEAKAASPNREERRWATVLFADLSDFTTMSEQMDAEDVKALAHRCAELMSEQVRRFGGTVLNVVGDQIVAVFGAPLSHEDDAERAVRCGLAIRDCAFSVDPAKPIRVHVGVNTGEVMAGMVGPQERCDYTVMGDTVNTAARLMSAAPSASVLAGEETWRATRRVVNYRQLPPVALKGKQQPFAVWEALDAAPLAQSRPLGTAPLVGRDDELALLSNIWLKVVHESRPHLVTVLGEPGIGKSRLVAEFERRFCVEALVLHGRCLPYGEAFGYGALSKALEEAAGITAELSTDIARLKLKEMIVRVIPSHPGEPEVKEIARHLALLSGLDAAADRSTKPADQRALHASVRRFLEELARRQPVCLMFEDIHWADDALLDLIEFIASRAKDAPLLIVAQTRPALLEKRPNWGRGVRGFNSIPVEPLSEANGRELILALCRERGLTESVAEQVGRGAGGNPLFAEELVAMIAERGTQAGIPSAIKALISARLDALPPDARHALQFAAVLGKSFWEGGVRALGSEGDVRARLETLEQADLLRAQPRSEFRGEREFAFKHDLIRDVAYEMLSRAERKTLHSRAADWIEQTAGSQLELHFDQLAHHAIKANEEERAVNYLSRAAERAGRTAAYRHEAALLATAITLAERRQQPGLVGQLHARCGRAFLNIALWAEATQELEAALENLESAEVERRVEVMVGLATASIWLGDRIKTIRSASEALPLAEQVSRVDLEAGAMGWLALVEHADGRHQEARALWQRAITRAGGVKVTSLAYAPHTFYVLGEYEQGIRLAEEAVQSFRGSNDRTATILALSHLGLNLSAKGRYAEATEIFAEARRFGREYETWRFLARSISMSSAFHLELLDFAGAEALAEEAREMARSANFPSAIVSSGIDLLLNFIRRQEVGRAEGLLTEVSNEAEQAPGWHGWVWKLRLMQVRGEFELGRGNYQDTLIWAEKALLESNSSGRVKYQILALWTRARALHAGGRTHEAIADLQQATTLARRIGDPASLVRTAAALLEIAGDDALLAEARATAKGILKALPAEEIRQRFANAEPLRVLGKFND